MIRKYAEIFCWKNVSSFRNAKATHIFSAKNIRILCIESAKTVNEMTLNELVKLTMLWTTGPWFFNEKQGLICHVNGLPSLICHVNGLQSLICHVNGLPSLICHVNGLPSLICHVNGLPRQTIHMTYQAYLISEKYWVSSATVLHGDLSSWVKCLVL